MSKNRLWCFQCGQYRVFPFKNTEKICPECRSDLHEEIAMPKPAVNPKFLPKRPLPPVSRTDGRGWIPQASLFRRRELQAKRRLAFERKLVPMLAGEDRR